ncbi:hypothetical protein L6452_46486 [Arctium lappa]|nr:hypothetical protein L6452_46486 [Arctium lappa]
MPLFLDPRPRLGGADPGGRHCQVGSLAGAAHLLKDNAGCPKMSSTRQKSRVEQKGKSSFDSDFHVAIVIQPSTRGTVDSHNWSSRLVEKPVARSYRALDYD